VSTSSSASRRRPADSKPARAAKTSPPARATPRARTRKEARPAEDADADAHAPRYQQIARELKAAIAAGRYPVGARLPTEVELCEHFTISRFTAREAVRLLATAGLVTRRQRAGTIVIALPGEARYAPTLSSINDLMQYARDTEMRTLHVGRIALDKARARAFGAEPGREWIHLVGIRREATGGAGRPRAGRKARPLCVTRVFINPLLEGIEARLRTRRSTIYALIENEYGRTIERVEQELSGTLLDAEDAARLEAEPGAPALLVVRRYFDAGGTLLEASESVHPADRFTFRMQLRR
jgi:DNA-binding GntR family transcriptional regulator